MKVEKAREMKEKALSNLDDVDLAEFIEKIAKAAAKGQDSVFTPFKSLNSGQKRKLERLGYKIEGVNSEWQIGGW